jgi:hypothetical protein
LATRAQLQAALTKHVIRRGVIYAELLLNRQSWRVKPASEDVVSTCVTKLFGDPGAWDPRRGSISTYLHLLIRSEVDHEATSADNTHCVGLDDEHAERRQVWCDRGVPPQQEIDVELVEAKRRLAAIRSGKIIELIVAKRGFQGPSTTDELRMVAGAMLNEITEPADIAAACNLPVEQVYELKRQITRKMQAWRNATPLNSTASTTQGQMTVAVDPHDADDKE